MDNKQVVIAMSGGVDSSVAAALLVQQGYQVIGMMLNLWSETDNEDNHRDDNSNALSQAKRVATLLKFPFFVIDAQSVFFQSVVQYFLSSYLEGKTPNPCLVCNNEIRWGFLLDHALAIGCDYLATGHYVRLENNSAGHYVLKRGIDASKDQSYVLHGLNQTQLSRSLFPLGNYTKSDVRQLAHDLQLSIEDKEESQDLCFIVNEDYRSFLARHAPERITPGNIINTQGDVLGRHSGLPYYTIGQRKGLRINSPTPYYVIKKDTKNNVLIVGKNEQRYKNCLYAYQVNWISGKPPEEGLRAQVMVRYRTSLKPCTIDSIEADRVLANFEQPVKDISPGQAAVFYDDEICLGGGIIQ